MRRALAFLTPLGRAVPPDGRTMEWFPAVGALLGLALGGIWWAAGELWPPAVAAALVVAADLALTGLLHIDGLSDTADGLLAPMSRDRRLEVMADPHAGAFGVTVVAAALLLRFAALASMKPDVVLLAALWGLSRTSMVIGARLLPYVRAQGLATDFLASPGRFGPIIGGLAGGCGVAIYAAGGGGLAAAGAVVAGAGAVLALARRRIGGFTGDVLGAAGVVGETAGLLVAAAKW